MSYKKLDIWKIAHGLVIDIHKMSLNLPAFEMYEEGKQIRRSIKSVKSIIVEGYGRRKYKAEFIKFIVYALGSNDETLDHLETLRETESLRDDNVYINLHERIVLLGKKLTRFLETLEKSHNVYNSNPVSGIQNRMI